MPCNQTLSGLQKDCSPSMGGIAEIYIANADDVTAVTVTDGKISAITMATGAKFKKYEFPRGTSNANSAYQVNRENGSLYVQSDINLVFNRQETAKRVEVTAIAQNDMVAITRDANGVFWFYGKDEPVTMSAGGAESGTARADRNGYTVSLQDNSKELPYEVNATIMDNIVD